MSRSLISAFSVRLCLVLIMGLNWGCGQKRAEKQSVVIGAILPLSGDMAAYGESARRGIDLAVKDINSNGGIQGRKLSVLYEDGRGSARDALSAFEKLVSLNRVPAVIGPLSSPEVLAIAPVAMRRRIVLLSPGASSPEITQAGEYIFRNCPSDMFEGGEMARFARKQLNLSRVAILHINSNYGVGLEKVFREDFERDGGSVLVSLAYTPRSTDFRPQMQSIRQVAPEAIYFIGYKELGLMLKQAGELGINVTMLSTALFEDKDVLEAAGGYAEGVIFTTSTYDTTSDAPRVRGFVETYQSLYGQVPDVFAALCYDAASILAIALEESSKSGEGINHALYRIKDFPSLLGPLSIDENGDATLPIAFKVVTNGQFAIYK